MDIKIRTDKGEEMVKINRHSSVEQVIKDHCRKNELVEKTVHLTYESKSLDPSLKLFYAGLPEGTILQIETCEESSKPVYVLLQVEHLCFSGKFQPEDNLWMILTELCPPSILNKFPYPLLSSAQNEIQGIEKIKNTILSSLEIQSDKVTLRLSPMKRKSTKSATSLKGKSLARRGEENVTPKNSDWDMMRKSPESGITYLGERKALLFTFPDHSEPADDLSDDFFELSPNELKVLYQELKKSREDLEEKPFMTRALKEQQRIENLEKKLEKYSHTILRIYFPNRMVLQGVFKPVETVDDVLQFVSIYLEDPSIQFYLYLTPPKTILPGGKRLIDVNLVPSAKIYFGASNSPLQDTNYIRDELMDKITSFSVANEAVAIINKREDSNKDEASTSRPGPSNASILNDSLSVPYSSSSGAIRKTPKDKIPKWFRP